MMPNTLYVLDFDETLVRFDDMGSEWWDKQCERYYGQHGTDRPDGQSLADWVQHVSFRNPKTDEEKVFKQNILDDWVKHVSARDPIHVDEVGFNGILEHCVAERGSHVIILTARNIKLAELTQRHLDMVVSPEAGVDIIFCSGENKGRTLENYIGTSGASYNHIVFVDDKLRNLKQVKDVHVDSQCYHMMLI